MVPLLRTLPGGNTANVAELVYALDLGSSGVTLGSSSLPIRTTFQSLIGVRALNRYDVPMTRSA